nr:unnamed protein product [Spirometra erinaceieuropaei]
MQPCFTPLVTANASATIPFSAIVELNYRLSESLETAEFLYDFLQFFAIHLVKGFLQIHEGRVEVGPHLLALFLKLAAGEDHASGHTTTAEAALAFRQEILFQMVVEAVKKSTDEDFFGDVQQEDASMVVLELTVTFPIIEMDDYGVLEILRDFSLTSHLLEERRQMIHKLGAAMLADRSRDRVRSGRFPAGELLHSLDFAERGREAEVDVGLCSVSCPGRQDIMPQTPDKRTIKVMAPCSHRLCADWPPISL